MTNWMDQSNIEERREEAFALLPSSITNFTRAAAKAWDLEPALLLAGALHHVAAVHGGAARLRHGSVGYSCAFNLLIVSDGVSSEDWYESMGEPWLGPARKHIRQHQAYGREPLLAELKGLLDPSPDLSGKAVFLRPDEREVLIRQKLAVYRPCVISREVTADAAVRAVEQSFDRYLLMLPGGVDPVFELLDAGRRKAAALARVLGMSWLDQDLPTKQAVPLRGAVHMAWRSEARHVRRLMLDRQSGWSQCPPPVLFLRQQTVPSYLPLPESESSQTWSALLAGNFSKRIVTREPRMWVLSAESDIMLRDFHSELAGMPTDPHPGWFNWLPALAVRLSLLLSELGGEASSGSSKALEIPAETMRQACLLARWLAYEHYVCLESLRQAPSIEGEHQDEDACIDFIDVATVKQQIVAKLMERGPLSPRELTRSFHKLPQKHRNAAVAQLVKGKQVILGADGRLAVGSGDQQVESRGQVPLTVSASAPF